MNDTEIMIFIYKPPDSDYFYTAVPSNMALAAGDRRQEVAQAAAVAAERAKAAAAAEVQEAAEGAVAVAEALPAAPLVPADMGVHESPPDLRPIYKFKTDDPALEDAIMAPET